MIAKSPPPEASKDTAAPGGAAEKGVAKKPWPLIEKLTGRIGWLKQLPEMLNDDDGDEDCVTEDPAFVAQYKALEKKVSRRSLLILGLLVLVVFLTPILQPIYTYDAMDHEKKLRPLVSLSAPNLTDQAILSWSATSITEILTFGFGDFDQRILTQRPLFTSDGWSGFTKAIREQNMRENFKMRQLVLTTVPANMPVIVSKGEDEDGSYNWAVEMPIIMTYTTNNNVTERKRGIVRLTIVRVPPKQNVAGIGIKGWMLFN